MLISHEDFFIQTVTDLKKKIKENTPYSIIRACGICRQLVADDDWLLKTVNKTTKIKISFIIKDFDRNVFKYGLTICWVTVDPVSGHQKEVDREEFLDTIVLSLKKHEYTVRDVIKTVSNKMGGVHSGIINVNNKRQKDFLNLDKVADLDYSTTMTAIKSICKVVLVMADKMIDTLNRRTPADGVSS